MRKIALALPPHRFPGWVAGMQQQRQASGMGSGASPTASHAESGDLNLFR
jgi:hypothetical protein